MFYLRSRSVESKSTDLCYGGIVLNIPISVDQHQLLDVLLNVATVRPVFIWGAPGIGKSSIVEKFANDVGLPCVSLLGSQLAPEDIIGVPTIQDGHSVFCPPRMIARDDPYVLFLDELNGCTQEVQKSFYSLIYERRIGEYHLPEGSVVIGAGNRMQDMCAMAATKRGCTARLPPGIFIMLRSLTVNTMSASVNPEPALTLPNMI